MKSLKYFHINNVKFNYVLEFQSNHKNDYWKHNAPLIEYCETIGVNIPHYCYHKNLSISGNCRMCLVELKNSPKPIVSCAMSAKSCLNNSEVFTNSPLVKKARENVLEFLLLNHPLDCPICDQGGECDLQDQSLYFGITKKRFYNFKRVVTDKNIGPIVKTVMTRCIHCTRCVRFAAEVAGTEDLGMFGRGLDSEIGTYVTKTFQSELSGNIIDLCPVGALTSKPYPFVSRSWELKHVSSIDFSDAFAENTQIYLKNNKVVKVNPGHNPSSNTTNWISDKTRFAFDGMFSPERILTNFVKSGTKEVQTLNSWQTLLNEVMLTLYFQDHLNKHFLITNNLYFVFDSNISLEVLNLLSMFSKKYSFVKLRKSENSSQNVDLESDFIANSSKNMTESLEKSTVCLLVGLNSRYESSSLNVKLRKRALAGNFKVFSIGSSLDLTFPVSNVGLSIDTLKSIAEGNHFFSQELSSSKSMIFASSSLLQRKDGISVQKLLKTISNKSLSPLSNTSNLNVINSSLNETGANYLNSFKSFTETDLNSSCGVYFLNTASQSSNLKKIVNLKLLNYLDSSDSLPKFCFEQNNGSLPYASNPGNTAYNVYNYVNLPNSTFFETKGTYLNGEGCFKKSVKIVPTNQQTKDDWQILRKVFENSKKINFSNNYKDSSLLSFNSKSFQKFKSFNDFLTVATSNLTAKTVTDYLNSSTGYGVVPVKTLSGSKSKLSNTKLKIWINDFYVGGKDPYSKQSSTMIKCSRNFRTNKHTFSHIN